MLQLEAWRCTFVYISNVIDLEVSDSPVKTNVLRRVTTSDIYLRNDMIPYPLTYVMRYKIS